MGGSTEEKICRQSVPTPCGSPLLQGKAEGPILALSCLGVSEQKENNTVRCLINCIGCRDCSSNPKWRPERMLRKKGGLLQDFRSCGRKLEKPEKKLASSSRGMFPGSKMAAGKIKSSGAVKGSLRSPEIVWQVSAHE